MNAINTAELARVFDLPEPTTWTKVGANRGKGIWRVDCPNGSFAVRMLRPGDDKVAEHETKMMRAGRRADLPVARVHAKALLDQRPVLLIEWMSGRELTGQIRTRPWLAHHLGRIFGEQQALIHGVQGQGGPDWIDYFGPVDQALRGRLEAAQNRSVLIHLDYYPANLAIKNGQISGILDWTNARFGDHRADLARTWALLNLVFRSSRKHPVQRLADRLFARGWRLGYRGAAGPQDDLAPYLAWAVSGLLRERIRDDPANAASTECRELERRMRQFREAAGLPSIALEQLF